MRHNGKVVVVVAGHPILARLTARVAWEHADTPRAAEA